MVILLFRLPGVNALVNGRRYWDLYPSGMKDSVLIPFTLRRIGRNTAAVLNEMRTFLDKFGGGVHEHGDEAQHPDACRQSAECAGKKGMSRAVQGWRCLPMT